MNCTNVGVSSRNAGAGHLAFTFVRLSRHVLVLFTVPFGCLLLHGKIKMSQTPTVVGPPKHKKKEFTLLSSTLP